MTARRPVAWIALLCVLAGALLWGAYATNKWEREALSGMVAARGQVARFGGEETYLQVWTDEIFADMVPIPNGLLASAGEGSRVRVFYSPETRQVILRSRRIDAPALCVIGAALSLTGALWLALRRRRQTGVHAEPSERAPVAV